MYINSADVCSDIRLTIRGNVIDVVKQFEYFGMIIDDRLQMNKHTDNVYKKSKAKARYFI